MKVKDCMNPRTVAVGALEPVAVAARVMARHNLGMLPVRDTAAATAMILARPELFADYEITKGKMDDVFLAVTGKSLSDGKSL